MTRLARVVLALFGLGLLGFGLLFLASPDALTSMVDTELPTGVSRQDIRAVYGGMFCGVAGLFLFCASRRDLLRPGLLALAAVTGGLVIGRVLGLLVDGAANALLYGLLALEIGGLVVAIAGLRARRT